MREAQDLPEGWTLRSLGDVATLVAGAGFPVALQGQPDHELPFFKVGNLGEVASGEQLTTSLHTITSETAKELGARVVPSGSTVFAKIGMAIRLNRRRMLGQPSCIDNNMMAAIPDPTVMNEQFLLRFLESVKFMPLAHATTVPAIRKSDLEQVQVPVPPLAVQERIVVAIDRILLRRSSAASHVDVSARRIKGLRLAALNHACSGRLTADWRELHTVDAPEFGTKIKRPRQFRELTQFEIDEVPEGWRWVQVDDLLPAGGIFDGPFGSHLKTSDYTDRGARVIRLENIGHLRFIDEKRTYVSKSKYESLRKHAVEPGDIVFSSFIGDEVRVCVLPEGLEREALAKADCFTLRPDDQVDPTYLALQLACPRSGATLAADVHGATRPRINTTQLRSLPVPICSIQEQREVVRRHKALARTVDDVERRVERASRRIEESFQTILASAMRDELTSVT